jgi:hypothetical protein
MTESTLKSENIDSIGRNLIYKHQTPEKLHDKSKAGVKSQKLQIKNIPNVMQSESLSTVNSKNQRHSLLQEEILRK